MDNFINFYQNLPLMINPIALRVGFFSLTWYSLMYLVAFLTVYLILQWRLKNDFKNSPDFLNISQNIENFFIYSIIGIVIGARLGYVLFYDWHFFLQHPLGIISPFDAMGNFVGIYGLSYHGGLLGGILAGIFFVKKYKINPTPSYEILKSVENLSLQAHKKEGMCGTSFWQMADFVIPAIPAGYFFGRIGNFLNGELYGRITDMPWGMYFLDENNLIMLRHPSQLYEAFFEGIVLFLILWSLRNGIKYKGKLFHVPCFILYVLGYGLIRFFIEFFRQPDTQIGLVFNVLTLGQVFCLIMIVISLPFFCLNRHPMT